jgi:hypothetical protein
VRLANSFNDLWPSETNSFPVVSRIIPGICLTEFMGRSETSPVHRLALHSYFSALCHTPRSTLRLFVPARNKQEDS